MRTLKPMVGPHSEHVDNPLSFACAYEQAREKPNRTYYTTGDHTPFVAAATTGKKGKHTNQRVLRFMSQGQERSRAYECCWGHRTNCNSTYIDCYTKAMDG